MPLVSGYHLHLPPGLHIPTQIAVGESLLPSLGNLHLDLCFS